MGSHEPRTWQMRVIMVPRKVSLWIASPFAFVRIWIRSVPLGFDRDRLASNYVDRNHIANIGGGQVQCDGSASPTVVDNGATDIVRRERSTRGVGDDPGAADSLGRTWGRSGVSGHLDWTGPRQQSAAVGRIQPKFICAGRGWHREGTRARRHRSDAPIVRASAGEYIVIVCPVGGSLDVPSHPVQNC